MNKTERIYKKILHDIIKGSLYQGQRLIEKELIDSYKISKTPLREALRKLEKTGLVKYNINCGYLVKRVLRKDAEEIYDLREIIDCLSVRKIIENITVQKIKKLKNIINDMELCIRDNEKEKYIELDRYMHKTLNKLSNNERLFEIAESLNYQICMLLKTSIELPERGIKKSFEEHVEIFNAIFNKDSTEAEKLVKKHIRNTKMAVLNYFDNLKFS
jgi:DNA-binding GntR family transcriptional regulator